MIKNTLSVFFLLMSSMQSFAHTNCEGLEQVSAGIIEYTNKFAISFNECVISVGLRLPRIDAEAGCMYRLKQYAEEGLIGLKVFKIMQMRNYTLMQERLNEAGCSTSFLPQPVLVIVD